MKRIDQQIAQAVGEIARWQTRLRLLQELKAWGHKKVPRGIGNAKPGARLTGRGSVARTA